MYLAKISYSVMNISTYSLLRSLLPGYGVTEGPANLKAILVWQFAKSTNKVLETDNLTSNSHVHRLISVFISADWGCTIILYKKSRLLID